MNLNIDRLGYLKWLLVLHIVSLPVLTLISIFYPGWIGSYAVFFVFTFVWMFEYNSELRKQTNKLIRELESDLVDKENYSIGAPDVWVNSIGEMLIEGNPLTKILPEHRVSKKYDVSLYKVGQFAVIHHKGRFMVYEKHAS